MSHPSSCRRCEGIGFVDGPPIVETVNGEPHEYSTMAPCDHDWWHDE